MAHGYNRDGTFKFNMDVTDVSISFAQSAGAMIAAPSDIINWLNQLFSGKIISAQSLAKMTKIIPQKNVTEIKIKDLSKNKPFSEVGIGAGLGLVYFKNNGFTWVHTGGMPGYEAVYAYNPASRVYLALAYSVKPKQQFISLKIADEVFRVIKLSAANQVPPSKKEGV